MKLVLVMMVLGGLAATAQNLPPGTHSVDDHTRENAVSARVRAAESALEKQDYRGAEAMLKQLAVERPKDAQVLYDLGFAEERNGEEDDAAAAYAMAFAADATLAEPEVALGLLDARRGKLEAAHRELSAVSEIATAAPALRARALRALASMDEHTSPAQASTELLAAVKLSGETFEDVLLSADLADRAGDAVDAEAAYRRALAMQPESVEAIAGLGHALKSQKKFKDAEDVLMNGLAKHPNDVQMTAELAAVYVSDGKENAAIPLVEALRGEDARAAADPTVTALLARIYAMNGRNQDAEPLYRKLVAAEPQDPAMLDALGSVLVKEMQYPEAEKVLAQAVIARAAFHDDAAWGEAAEHLAYAASKNKQPQVTLQALAARATVLPNSPASLFLAATAHDSLHQKKEAEQAYRAFLAISAGKLPDEEFEARHRLIALEHEK